MGKTNMKNLFICITLAILSQSAFAGPRIIGNGGDVHALEFVTTAQQVLSYLQKFKFEGLDTKALGQAIDSAKVESTEEPLKLNGMDKDAINYPTENRIVFNSKRWGSLATNERLALVLHEYLGLLGKNDANYQFSKLLLQDMTLRGASEVAIQGKNSWVRVQGDAAKALYDTLAVPAENNRGEAGADLYFKIGKAYSCFTDVTTDEYACTIMISNPKTGLIK
jgi:hypothetical protein